MDKDQSQSPMDQTSRVSLMTDKAFLSLFFSPLVPNPPLDLMVEECGSPLLRSEGGWMTPPGGQSPLRSPSPDEDADQGSQDGQPSPN